MPGVESYPRGPTGSSYAKAGTSEAGSGILTPYVLADDAARESYRSATPWPHIVFDHLLDPDVISAAETEELGPGLDLGLRRTARMIKAESSEPSGAAARSVLDSLSSSAFVSFLETLTGIEDLTPDSTHLSRGLYVFPPGAYQAIHRDFRRHPVTGMFHRLTVLVFLNSSWNDDYGGAFELWNARSRVCGRRIAPLAGNVVIFEPGPKAIHGVPDPIRCPPGRARLSLTCSYFTAAPGPDDRRESRFLRPKRPQDPWYLRFVPVRDGIDGLRQIVRRGWRVPT